MERIFERIAGKVASWSGRPPAFILALTVIIVWGVTGPIFRYSDTWQLIINTGTTIVTFLMVFLIQNAQNRDGSAIQAKLDEMIRALKGPRNEFVGIEHLSQQELEQIKAKLEQLCGGDGDHGSDHASFARLLGRL
jgi:low affinity Fe/Cu permease